jgi:hypothetical protein
MFWKPGAPAPWAVDRENEREQAATAVIPNLNARLSLDVQRRSLPIAELRSQVLYLVERYLTVVIVGSTGCGKSTQIPQYLNEAGLGLGRIVPPLIHFTPDSLRYPIALFLKRRCDRTLGGLGRGRALRRLHAAAARGGDHGSDARGGGDAVADRARGRLLRALRPLLRRREGPNPHLSIVTIRYTRCGWEG